MLDLNAKFTPAAFSKAHISSKGGSDIYLYPFEPFNQACNRRSPSSMET